MFGSLNSCGKRGKHDSIKKRVRCIMWITPDRLFVLSILIPLDCVIEIRLYDWVNQDSIMWSGKSRFDYTSDIVVRLYVLSIDSTIVTVYRIRSLSSNQKVITGRLVPSDESPLLQKVVRRRRVPCEEPPLLLHTECCWQMHWCISPHNIVLRIICLKAMVSNSMEHDTVPKVNGRVYRWVHHG